TAVKAAREENEPRQDEGLRDRARILQGVPKDTRGLQRQPISIDVDRVDELESLLAAASGGADDRDLVPRVAQRAGFLPDPPVERARQILQQDEDTPHQQIPS